MSVQRYDADMTHAGREWQEKTVIDKQVIEALFRLHEKLPPDVTQRIEEILRQHAQRANEEKRMEEIKELVKRIDFRWENGFMDEEEYLQKRRQLQLEIECSASCRT